MTFEMLTTEARASAVYRALRLSSPLECQGSQGETMSHVPNAVTLVGEQMLPLCGRQLKSTRVSRACLQHRPLPRTAASLQHRTL